MRDRRTFEWPWRPTPRWAMATIVVAVAGLIAGFLLARGMR